MKVVIFGLGYVGTVCGVCLAQAGHTVTGVDIQPEKVELVNAGRAPVIEPGLQQALEAAVQAGTLKATADSESALAHAEVILLCVGTPSRRDGSLNLEYLEKVAAQVGQSLDKAANFPVVAIRSTVPPGTLDRITRLLAQASGLQPGQNFGVVSNPEFLREGSALSDFNNPAYTLIGTSHPEAIEPMKKLYGHLNAPFYAVSTGTAEILKYVNNSFHALKIAFANEIGQVCKAYGIDSHEVMDYFCRDTRLNTSAAYLKPGFAYGGSCLPKDLQALTQAAHSHNIKAPVLSHIADSNDEHIRHCITLIEDAGSRRLGFLGLSFKAETDDLRESPAVRVIETLLGRGYHIKIYDPHINLSRLVGANREYIENRITHLSSLLVGSLAELLENADTVVVTNNDAAYSRIMDAVREGQTLVDFTRVPGSPTSGGNYHGACW